jgi:hypothetical protein
MIKLNNTANTVWLALNYTTFHHFVFHISSKDWGSASPPSLI